MTRLAPRPSVSLHLPLPVEISPCVHGRSSVWHELLWQGNYHQAIDRLGQSVALLDGAQRHERFGTSTVVASSSCAWLAWGHAELGMFPEGSARGDEGLQIAEAVNHPASLLVAWWGSGLLALRHGDLLRALALLERAMGICQEADLPTFFPRIAAPWARRMP